MRFVEITYRYEANSSVESAPPSDAYAARRRLDAGSRAFASLLASLGRESGTARRVIQVDARDLGLLDEHVSAPTQRPYAAVLGCSDAQVPVELIFNEGPNDLFVVRVAGNVLGDDTLASLEIRRRSPGRQPEARRRPRAQRLRCDHGRSRRVPGSAGYLSLASEHVLRSLIYAAGRRSRIREADGGGMGPDVTRRPGYREALIETSVVANAALAAYTVQEALGGSAPDGLRAVYGVYLLHARETWALHGDGNSGRGWRSRPRDAAAFTEFGDAVIRSQRIASILDAAS